MPLSRILEVEVMDTAAEAADYNAMDHSAVNALFAQDLLKALASGGRKPPDANEQYQGAHAPRSPLEILDLGTGTALIPIDICRRTSACRVLAVDLATHMLALARQNIAAAGFASRIQLDQIDAKALRFADGQFDVVISNSIIHHIPEPMRSLQEAVRVCKPGGLLFFRDLLRPDDESTVLRLVQAYAGSENAHSQQMFADSLHAALSLDEIRRLLVQLGFPADSVQATSDRHWTWIGWKPG
jgi:ubiquinone/menaquinone biosynthesis C-methylase UbiE